MGFIYDKIMIENMERGLMTIMEFPNVNNKLAFFDFDRTLVAHAHSPEFMRDRGGNYFMECLHMLTNLEAEHAKDQPLPCMQWYAKKLFSEGYGLYVLTHELFNLRNDLKMRELARFYPDTPMTYLTVDSPEHKIDMMRAVAYAEGCNLSDVIFVDDQMGIVSKAIRAGIDGKHLSDIAVLYESQIMPQEQAILIKPREPGKCQAEEVPEKGLQAAGVEFTEEDLEETMRQCRLLAKMNENNKGEDMPF